MTTPSFDFAELLALRSAWSTTRSAGGGLAALAGFDFQLTKALVTIIRQEINGQGQTFIETLSDIVAADQGVLITQAKRTLSSAALHAGLAELWEIYTLAGTNTPVLQPLLRFEIASEFRTLRDWQASIDRWTSDSADPAALKQFKARVSVSVTPQPRMEAARLLLNEFREIDPFARIDGVLGRLLSAPVGLHDRLIEEFRIDLRALRERARELERRFELWGGDDRPPTRVALELDERRAVRIGERLTVADLREGRLCNRAVYDQIERDCEQWLAADREPYKLPAYWLSGRSGCGKSAALLHLAARIYAQNPDRVVLWLGDRVDRIQDAVRWVAPQLRDGRTVLLVLDDPFTAARQERFTRAVEEAQLEWDLIRAEAPNDDRLPPLLLCCGPTEQRAAVEDNCAAHIACEGFDLPIEQQQDLHELAHWYAARTGKPVEAMSGNVLLVQQMFEWAKGSIAAFAQHFRERLRTFGQESGELVFATIAQILALNRLYVDYPASELNTKRATHPDLDAALITLGEEESHFDFDASLRGGVRLTHPHLANAIYIEWFGRNADRPHRRRHLEEALSAALDQVDELPEVRHAPLWSIGRLAQVRTGRDGPIDPDMAARVDLIRHELRDVLTGIYPQRCQTSTPLEDLPVWLVLRARLGLDLSPDPGALLMDAIAAADAPVRGLRLSCHRLLSEADDQVAHLACVADCLNRLADWRDIDGGWHDWAPVAIDLVQRFGAQPILASIARLVRTNTYFPRKAQLVQKMLELTDGTGRPIVLDWLQRTVSSQAGWGPILQRLLASGHCETSDAVAQRFLQAARNDDNWAFVWLALLDAERGDRASLIDDALAWVGFARRDIAKATVVTNVGWDRVWQRLSSTLAEHPERSRLIALGHAWMNAVDADHEGWPRIWKYFWDDAQQRADRAAITYLLGVAETKLYAARPSLMGWSHVWNDAVGAADDDLAPYLWRLGLEWLRLADAEHRGWGFVWERLVRYGSQALRPELAHRGRAWLDVVSQDHASWPFVMLELIGAAPARLGDPLIDAAVAWFERDELHLQGWLWLGLRLCRDNDPEICARVRDRLAEWLPANAGHRSWRRAFRHCSDIGLSPEELQRIGAACRSLLEDDTTGGSNLVGAWDGLFAVCGDLAEIEGYALKILARDDVSTDGLVNICGRMVRTLEEPSRRMPFVAKCVDLLARDISPESWLWIWESLAASPRRHEVPGLLALARQWLRDHSPDDEGWHRVYLRIVHLDKALAIDPDLSNPARRWLEACAMHPSWSNIWRLQSDRVALLANQTIGGRAFAILEHEPDDRNWARIWLAFFNQRPEPLQDTLRDLALTWLERREFGEYWSRIVRAVLPDCTLAERDHLRAISCDGLYRQPLADGWAKLFDVVRAHWPDVIEAPAVRDLAEAWIARPADQFKWWYKVWSWRLEIDPAPWSDAAAKRAMSAWLLDTPTRKDIWLSIFSHVAPTLDLADAPALAARGVQWLDGAPGAIGWPNGWEAVWRLLEAAGLATDDHRAVGQQWLSVYGNHNRAWLVRKRVSPTRLRMKRKAPGVSTGG